MLKTGTLVILDWDDTLFPTSYIIKNVIDIVNPNTIKNNIIYFKKIDDMISTLLTNFMKYGTVVIVTNAILEWLYASSNILPNTRKIMENIKMISARERYQKVLPDSANKWKKLVFDELISEYLEKSHIKHVISVGDAEYEFNALVDMYKKNRDDGTIYFKSVRLLQSPNIGILLDQLQVLNKSIHKICTHPYHMDLVFKNME